MRMLPKSTKRLAQIFHSFALTLGFISIVFAISTQFTIDTYAEEDLDKIEQEIKEAESDLRETEGKLNQIKAKADEITSTIKNLTSQISVNQGQINALNSQINLLTGDINNLNKKLELKKIELDASTKIRNKTLRNLYISNQQSLFEILFSNSNLSSAAENAAYHFRFVDSSEQFIGSLNNNIKQYESDKNEIEQIKTQVEEQKKGVQALVNKLASQVNSSQNQLNAVSQQQASLQQQRNEISKRLSELSAKQKALLEEKTGTFTTSVGDVPSTGDPASQADYDPGFEPAFAAFSFGAPHRMGMSQYGAKGRAESGQDYKDILEGYYGDIEIIEPDLPDNIRTDKGEFDLDGTYLKGLAEMPASWPMDALKAQAIAARTYAMAYVGWRTGNTDPGGRICTTESCQVWSSSKANASSAARWHQAVEETEGMIMVGKDSGEIFSALYAASSGGYNYSYTSLGHKTSGGWDTKCGSRDCWTSNAYESIGGSPWLYKGWYKTRGNKSCGRSHPWLNEEEFADIVGAIKLIKEDSDNQKHLSQPDAESCWGEDIDDTWSRDKVREESGIEEIEDVDVSYSSGGYTAEVKIKTNDGEVKVNGEDFKAIFNLRAPGAIHLKSLLFNIEVKD